MMQIAKAYLAVRRRRQQVEAYRRGFGDAAARMLFDNQSPAEIKRLAAYLAGKGSPVGDAFAQGLLAGTEAFVKYYCIPDDRE